MADLVLLSERLGLDDAELLEVFDLDPLSVIAGETGHLPQLAILLALTDEALEHVSTQVLRSWVRARGVDRRTPLELLRSGDFAAFEDRLRSLIERGFVLRAGS